MLEWDKQGTESRWCLRIVAGHEIWQSFTGNTDDGGYDNRNSYAVMIIKSKAIKSFCWLF